jgi:hypothetical protein
MPEKEHFGIYKKSKLFPEDQLQMEHFTIKDGSRISFIDSLEPSMILNAPFTAPCYLKFITPPSIS